MLQKISSTLLIWLIFLLAVNIVFLDIVVFSAKKDQTAVSVARSELADDCGKTCLEQIRQEVARLQPESTVVPTGAPSVPAATNAKEYYIPLGSGQTKSSEWADILGAEAYVNTNNYPRITKVLFEIYGSIPTANGELRVKLFDVSDKHDVWFSEVVLEGNTVVRKEVEVTLEPGNKLYRVMAKSTLSYEATVVNARLKLLTE